MGELPAQSWISAYSSICEVRKLPLRVVAFANPARLHWVLAAIRLQQCVCFNESLNGLFWISRELSEAFPRQGLPGRLASEG